jgi:hypothetical protein
MHSGIKELNLIGYPLSDSDLGKLLYWLKGNIQKLNVEDNSMHTLGLAAIIGYQKHPSSSPVTAL